MIKIILIIFFFSFIFSKPLYAKGGSNDGKTLDTLKIKAPSKFAQSIKYINHAKKLEKKEKTKKAKKFYKKAFDHLIDLNMQNPSNAYILSYLGFTSQKLGEFDNAEIYYKMGLSVDKNNFTINEYLGELYVITKRIDLAKERLKVLETCNCSEFKKLSTFIRLNNF